ncbi:hypothetical protein [Cytophaga aurantiaca]|uniref:hypothetical protein n=1 Tax=Cytophaga aurantiaca TaxID=29530 RepID=UPI000372593D|nr:hypothetical protein [Cytophaga aurantiaca]
MKEQQDNLTEAINLLKKKQSIELRLLKEQVHVVHESIKPINIIKNAYHQAVNTPDIKNNLIDNIIGMASGYISKKIFVGGSHNPLTHIVGNLLQMGVTNVTAKNSDTIRSISEKVMQFVLKKRVKTT